MDAYSPAAAHGRRGLFASQPVSFQRGEGRLEVRKPSRKVALRARHVIGLVLLAAGIFYAVHESYLFLISWDKLSISGLDVRCRQESLRRVVEADLARLPLGNILLCDIETLRARIQSFPWVRQARLQKVYPSTLRIDVEERIPAAVLDKGNFILIDREGVELQKVESLLGWGLPVVRDSALFRTDSAEKLRRAWAALEALAPEERAGVDTLDVSYPDRLILCFKDLAVRIIVAEDTPPERIRDFLGRKEAWEEAFGPLDIADLRLEGRAIITPREPEGQEPLPGPGKEFP